jgi:mitogen-activated protein kinase kinase
MMERHNRKSHLAPQLSPSSKAFLREGSSPPSSSNDRTPTSSDSQATAPGEKANGAATPRSAARPFPMRTSSANQVPNKDGVSPVGGHVMNIPIRPAPGSQQADATKKA